jgi:clan AA aspartic protease
MTGHVAAHRALMSVPFRVASNPNLVIEFVIDTGFLGFLALPPAAIAALNLPRLRVLSASLADGSQVLAFVHAATIVWNGAEHDVEVLALGKRPLLGTLLLDGHDVSMQFRDGGLVTVDSL